MYNGFELCEAEAISGKEEYLNSEKYEIRAWDWDRPGHIKADIRFLNGIRNAHPALRHFTNLCFYNAWNDRILYYGKRTARSEEHTSELQSLMRTSYAVFCLKKKK